MSLAEQKLLEAQHKIPKLTLSNTFNFPTQDPEIISS